MGEAEIYPNSPLQEVVCEVRFDGDLAIDSLKHLFHDQVKDKYPKILVPMSKTEAAHLVPYHFQGPSLTDPKIQFAINRLSLHHYKYSGHAALHAEFFRLFSILEKVVKIPKLNRIGMRYVNMIPYSRIDGRLPLEHFLKIGLKMPGEVLGSAKVFSTELQLLKNKGLLTLRLNSVINPMGEEAFVLDLDHAIEGKLDSSQISAYFNEARGEIRTLFESIITDRYRQFLSGESL